MKVKLEAFSIEMKEKSDEVTKLNTRILELEVENEKIKNDVANVPMMMKNVIEQAVVATTNSFVEQITTQQKSMETQTTLLFNKLKDQVAMLHQTSRYSPLPLSGREIASTNIPFEAPTQRIENGTSNYCGSCDQSFSSKKIYHNHLKTHHNSSRP